MKTHVVVAYDVVLDRHRARLLKRLKGYLEHVQKSVFEGELTDRRFQQLLEMLEREVDLEVDTVRVYTLCARCQPAVRVIGTGVLVEAEGDEIV